MDTHLIGKKRKNAIEMFLPFYLLLSQYEIGIVNLGNYGLLSIAIMQLFEHNFRIQFVKLDSITLMFVYLVVNDFIKLFFNIDNAQTVLNYIIEYSVLYILSIYVARVQFNEETLYKSSKIAGGLFVVGLGIQLFQVTILNTPVSPISIIPGYSLREGLVSFRPSSFFSEPALFATNLMPLLFLTLKHKDFLFASLTTLAVVASTSTVGAILSFVLWIFFLIQVKMSRKSKALLAIAFLIVIVIILFSSVFQSSLLKLEEVLKGRSTVESRIINGFEIIKTLNWNQWIWGNRYHLSSEYISDNLNNFSADSTIHLYIKTNSRIFMNSFSLIIFRYGIIGLLLFLSVLYKRLKRKNYQAKPFLIMIMVSIFGQSIFLNSIFFSSLILILLYDRI